MQRGISKFTIAVAGAVIVIVVASGLYFSNFSFLQTNPVINHYPLSAETSNSTLGLELKLDLNSTMLASGMAIAVNITEFNTENSTNVVNASDAWPGKGLALGPCGSFNYPIGVAIFQGYYTQSNISSASSPLSLYQPGEYMCPLVLADITSYKFQPMSHSAEILGPCIGSCIQINVTSRTEAGGYWSSGITGRTFTSFPQGTYTVVGGDEWGQILVLHFTVSELSLNSTKTTIASTQAASKTANTYSGMVLKSSRTFSYDNIPPFEFVGDFSVQLMYNGTGHNFPANSTSSYKGYSFAFNVTTPEPKSNYPIFDWTPPCSSNLGTPCEANETVLPSPENATVYYLSNTLLIMWYKNSSGLYITFQEYEEGQSTAVTISPSQTVTQQTDYSMTTTTVCYVPTSNLTSQMRQMYTSNQNATFKTYTTINNPCS